MNKKIVNIFGKALLGMLKSKKEHKPLQLLVEVVLDALDGDGKIDTTRLITLLLMLTKDKETKEKLNSIINK